MPTVTCPYCQTHSESKFLHKQHLREYHAALFANNINTSITGASVEVARQLTTVNVHTTDSLSFVDGDLYVRFQHGFRDFNVVFSMDLIWPLLADQVFTGLTNVEHDASTLGNSSVTADAETQTTLVLSPEREDSTERESIGSQWQCATQDDGDDIYHDSSSEEEDIEDRMQSVMDWLDSMQSDPPLLVQDLYDRLEESG